MKYLEKLLLLSLRTGVDAQVHVAVPVDVAVDVEDHEHATVRVKIPEAVNKVRIFIAQSLKCPSKVPVWCNSSDVGSNPGGTV